METIELRAHHLGVVYNIVALAGGDVRSKSLVREAITEFSNQTYKEGYKVSVVEKTHQLLIEIFYTESSIKIIPSLDWICIAGCIQDREVTINECVSRVVRDRASNTVSVLCKNTKATEDQVIADMFEVVIGETYDGREIIKRACILWKKYRTKDWQGLMDCYRVCYPTKYSRFFKEDIQCLRRP